MSIQALSDSNVLRINELWGIHFYEGSPELSRCLVFVLDTRFIETEGIQHRLGVSFGSNPFTMEMNMGFVRPPIHPGRYLFGLHLVATKHGQLTLFDQWIDGFPAGDDGDLQSANKRAEEILKSMTDEEFRQCIPGIEDSVARIVQDGMESEPMVIAGEAF